MDKDRNAGSAKDFVGKVEGAVGSMAGDAKTQASGLVREVEGFVQNLYGQAEDAFENSAVAKRLRTIRSARCWSPAASALRWRC